MNWINAILPVIKLKFGTSYNPNDRYFIALQGSSSSGKTSFAAKLTRNLENGGIKTLLVNLDNFYKTADNPGQEDPNYDFDNPDSFKWDVVFKLIKAINEGHDELPILRRRKDKNTEENIEYIPNPKPQVVIIEGIYAFNCINEFKFNCDELDASETFKDINNLYTKNELYNKDLKILKVFLPLCKEKFLSVRLARDLIVNKKKEEVIYRFEKMIWPDTVKFVYSDNELNDIAVVHGNFDEDNMNNVLESILNYFNTTIKYGTGKSTDDHRVDFVNAVCTSECLANKTAMLVLQENAAPAYNKKAISGYLKHKGGDKNESFGWNFDETLVDSLEKASLADDKKDQ